MQSFQKSACKLIADIQLAKSAMCQHRFQRVPLGIWRAAKISPILAGFASSSSRETAAAVGPPDISLGQIFSANTANQSIILFFWCKAALWLVSADQNKSSPGVKPQRSGWPMKNWWKSHSCGTSNFFYLPSCAWSLHLGNLFDKFECADYMCNTSFQPYIDQYYQSNNSAQHLSGNTVTICIWCYLSYL